MWQTMQPLGVNEKVVHLRLTPFPLGCGLCERVQGFSSPQLQLHYYKVRRKWKESHATHHFYMDGLTRGTIISMLWDVMYKPAPKGGRGFVFAMESSMLLIAYR